MKKKPNNVNLVGRRFRSFVVLMPAGCFFATIHILLSSQRTFIRLFVQLL
jgi:hypothetical protein